MSVTIPKPGTVANCNGLVLGDDDKLYVRNSEGVYVLASEQDTSINTNESAEAAQLAAETAQGLAETAQTGAETAQGLAETAKTGAETAQGLAETAKTNAETAETNAETAQGLAETAQTGAETAQGLAETAQQGAEAAASAAVAEVIAIADNQMELRTAEITGVTVDSGTPAGATMTITANTAEPGSYTSPLTLEGGELGEPVALGNVSWNSNMTPAQVATAIHDAIELNEGYTSTTNGATVTISNVLQNEVNVGTHLVFAPAGIATTHTDWVIEETPGTTTIEMDNLTPTQLAWDWEKKICIAGQDFEATDGVATIDDDKVTIVIETANITGAYTPLVTDDLSPAYYDYSFTHNLNTAFVNLFVFAKTEPTKNERRNMNIEGEIYSKVVMPDANAITATLTNYYFYSCTSFAAKISAPAEA